MKRVADERAETLAHLEDDLRTGAFEMEGKYQVRSYYQQNISRPHSYEERPFNSKKAGIAWAKTAHEWVFQVDVWEAGKLVACQTRWSGKNWKHYHV